MSSLSLQQFPLGGECHSAAQYGERFSTIARPRHPLTTLATTQLAAQASNDQPRSNWLSTRRPTNQGRSEACLVKMSALRQTGCRAATTSLSTHTELSVTLSRLAVVLSAYISFAFAPSMKNTRFTQFSNAIFTLRTLFGVENRQKRVLDREFWGLRRTADVTTV